MSNRGTLKHSAVQRALKRSRRWRWWRLSACVGLGLGVVVLAVALLLFVFGGALLNAYGKPKLEQGFAAAHPGYALRLGRLDYSVGAGRLVAQSVTVSASNLTLKSGRVSLTGVRWARLLRSTAALADVLAHASLDATNLDAEFPQAHYLVRCARLRASVPGAELLAEGTELRPLGEDEAFFAAHAFRTPRFHIILPECRVLGLAYGEALQGTSFRARSVHLDRPWFDALVNRDKPAGPFQKGALMVHEALAAIRQPLQVDSLSLTNGLFRYCERLAVGADPAVLTIGAVNLSVAGIANRGKPAAAIQLQGQGELMNAGTMKLLMSIPITPPDFSLHYSGSLSAMDLTRLGAFLEIAEHIRIKSGSAQEAVFEIDITAGQARGRVRALYKDLEVALLDKQTGTESGAANRVASFLENVLKIRKANPPEGSTLVKEGVVNYTRKPDDQFQQFAWFALRSGVLDVISH